MDYILTIKEKATRERLLKAYAMDALKLLSKGILSRSVEEDKCISIFDELLQVKREINKLYE